MVGVGFAGAARREHGSRRVSFGDQRLNLLHRRESRPPRGLADVAHCAFSDARPLGHLLRRKALLLHPSEDTQLNGVGGVRDWSHGEDRTAYLCGRQRPDLQKGAQVCGRTFLRVRHNAAMTDRTAFDGDGMGAFRQALLDVCDELIKRGVVSSMNDWSNKAGIKSEATVRNFMAGRSRSLSIETYAALATVAERPIAALLGEDVPRTEKERLILEGYRNAPDRGKAAIEAQALREIEDQQG